MNEHEEQRELLREKLFRRDRRSVPAARAFARWALYDWALDEGALGERTADVVLCVSELATNAIQHGVPVGRGFLLRVRCGSETLRVEVHDGGGGVPRTRVPEGESGRGLVLVEALADKWGVGEREAGPGKVVWCEFGVLVGA
ncbi:ATP-binding protein [Streptomyces sp. NPDC050504]|uniref:ATP-binding protein n=1 Tax=Streptomyces sp. NPDC050504 TaxID=3365618 RepID=UPI0037ACFC5E